MPNRHRERDLVSLPTFCRLILAAAIFLAPPSTTARSDGGVLISPSITGGAPTGIGIMGTYVGYSCKDIACNGIGLTLGLNDFRSPELHFAEIGVAVSAMFLNLYVGAGGRFDNLQFQAPHFTVATGFMMFLGFGRVYSLRESGGNLGFEAGLALALPANKLSKMVKSKNKRPLQTPNNRAGSEDLGGQLKKVDVDQVALQMRRSLESKISLLSGCEKSLSLGDWKNRTDQTIRMARIREILINSLRLPGLYYVSGGECKLTGYIDMKKTSNVLSYQFVLQIHHIRSEEIRLSHSEFLRIRINP